MRYFYFIVMFILFGLSSNSFAVTNTFTNAEDSYGRSTSPTIKYGSAPELLADGVSQDPDNGNFGEVVTFVKWDISSIPPSSTVTGVIASFNYTNESSGIYNFYSQDSAWSEGTVTWDDLDPGTEVVATVPPFSLGVVGSGFNADGIALVQGWVDGSIQNNGLILRTGGTNNGIIMDSTESAGPAPALKVTYTANETLEERVAFLENLLAGVTRSGDDIFYDGVNVHIRNGLGTTNGNPADPENDGGIVNGLGNLIVGYNEIIDPYEGPTPVSDKTGSHNVIVGHGHNYSSFGGLVVGKDNWISGAYSSISGGKRNNASGASASVSGGNTNTASIFSASVSGGIQNEAIGVYSSISGGFHNTASGFRSSVSGGISNEASGDDSSVSGGTVNTASADSSSVSGGNNNTASGLYSTVSGGEARTATGTSDWVAGSLFEDN